jgi:Beta xylosidase C-terminal Concanavalin A-like domain
MSKKRSRSACVLALVAASAALGSAAGFAPPQNAPLASSFPGPLWDIQAPNGGTASVVNAHLLLNVPGGSNHDALQPGNEALRVMQPIGNVDFDVSIKIDSRLVATEANTSQGLMVLADPRNFFTFALGTDGKNIALNVHTVTGGVVAKVFENPAFSEYQNPMYLRINRTGSSYIAYYSVDGNVWTQAVAFRDTKVPTSIGPFAGNYNPTPSRAVPVVMSINWFDIL